MKSSFFMSCPRSSLPQICPTSENYWIMKSHSPLGISPRLTMGNNSINSFAQRTLWVMHNSILAFKTSPDHKCNYVTHKEGPADIYCYPHKYRVLAMACFANTRVSCRKQYYAAILSFHICFYSNIGIKGLNCKYRRVSITPAKCVNVSLCERINWREAGLMMCIGLPKYISCTAKNKSTVSGLLA